MPPIKHHYCIQSLEHDHYYVCFSVRVTARHIHHARRLQRTSLPAEHRGAYCPVALALKATGLFKYVNVGSRWIYLDERCYPISPYGALSRFIRRFDRGHAVEPLTTVIAMPRPGRLPPARTQRRT
jgi:hypothetical protein